MYTKIIFNLIILNRMWIKGYVTCSDVHVLLHSAIIYLPAMTALVDATAGIICFTTPWQKQQIHSKGKWHISFQIIFAYWWYIWGSRNIPFLPSPWVNLYVTPCMLKLSALSLALSYIHWTWAGSSPSTGTPSEIKVIWFQFFGVLILHNF